MHTYILKMNVKQEKKQTLEIQCCCNTIQFQRKQIEMFDGTVLVEQILIYMTERRINKT